MEGQRAGLAVPSQRLHPPRLLHGIEFRSGHDARLPCKQWREAGKLVLDNFVVPHGIAACEVAEVDQVDENLGALDVAQEAVAQPVALVGAFDQARNVGHQKGIEFAEVDYPEVGAGGW